MTIYDDDRVIALLHDAVPPVPELPDRLAAVRHRAGRQRARMWTQTLGVTVTVLLLAGVASAVAGGGEPRTVRPVKDPVGLVADAFTAQRSVRFDVTMHPVGDVPGVAAADRAKLDGHLTGALTHDGDLQVDGNLGIVSALTFDDIDVHVRIVDGVTYSAVPRSEPAPQGKTWVSSHEGHQVDATELRRMLRMAGAFADSVTYVRNTTSRGVPVAEYRVTTPERYTNELPVDLVVAIDADGLPRRIDADFAAGAMFPTEVESEHLNFRIHVTAELFGYGDDVAITAPPAGEVTTQDALDATANARIEADMKRYRQCVTKASADKAMTEAEVATCGKFLESSSGGSFGTTHETFTSSGGVTVRPMPATASPRP
jgi:hypothetical protein